MREWRPGGASQLGSQGASDQGSLYSVPPLNDVGPNRELACLSYKMEQPEGRGPHLHSLAEHLAETGHVTAAQ